jgi:hypothetical protein
LLPACQFDIQREALFALYNLIVADTSPETTQALLLGCDGGAVVATLLELLKVADAEVRLWGYGGGWWMMHILGRVYFCAKAGCWSAFYPLGLSCRL